MSFLKKLTGLFTRGGRDDSLLLQGIELAKAKRPADAIEVYNRLLKSSSTGDETRARALFNRALAHSALDNDEQAITDLEAVLKLPDLPDNVQTAARTQLARVKRRNKEP